MDSFARGSKPLLSGTLLKLRTRPISYDTSLRWLTKDLEAGSALLFVVPNASGSTVPALTGHVQHFLPHYFIEFFPPIQVDMMTSFLDD